MPRIFADSWIWVALNNTRDNFHKTASSEFQRRLDEGYLVVTTNFVLSEAYTNLRRWGTSQVSIEFGQKVQSAALTGAVEIVRITADDEILAWELFEKYSDQPKLSYADCTSFAVMRRLKLTEALTGDRHFKLMGFTIRP